MNRVDVVWAIGRPTIGGVTRLVAPIRSYGADRMPLHGGVVVACNHFSWLDPAVLGTTSPRTIYYMAKMEAHGVPGLGELIRAFGTFSVRRGESDREAVRRMREIVREGKVLGMFVEGTRQRAGVPGTVQPGAAMVAVQEKVPVVPVAIHGTQHWKVGNFAPVSIAWGEPLRFDELPRNAKGYREASARIQDEIHRLWHWLVELHELARRPAVAVPPAA